MDSRLRVSPFRWDVRTDAMTEDPPKAIDFSQPLAVISDIHANLPALETVLNEIHRRGIKQIAHLGDVIGYGPQPVECLERVLDEPNIVFHLLGNHDRNLMHLLQTPSLSLSAVGMNKVAASTLTWTRSQIYGEHPFEISDVDRYKRERMEHYVRQVDLGKIDLDDPLPKKKLFQSASTKDQLQAMKAQVLRSYFQTDGSALTEYRREMKLLELGRRVFAHFKATPPDRRDGEAWFAHDNIVKPGNDDYTMNGPQQKLFGRTKNIATLDDTCAAAKAVGVRAVFIGHLHHARIYPVPKAYRNDVDVVVNVGSVGFAREDKQRRATFAVYTADAKRKVEMVRLEYPWERVARMIENRGLLMPKAFQT